MTSLFHRIATRVKYANPKTKCKYGIGFSILLILTVIVYLRITADPNLLVVIVEEHHEVLPYWFDAAQSGGMPKTGITLLHIDGHSDEAAPIFIKDMPMFRWLENRDEVGIYMQRNDVFIQAAVMASLISREIFVWPSWSKTGEPEYTKDTVGLGYFIYKQPGGSSKETYFCECHSMSIGDRPDCVYMNFTLPMPDQELSPEQCQIKTTYLSEHIIEDLAIKKFQSGLWITSNDSYILDIDEDYFGCESGADPFVKGGVSWKVIKLLNKNLKHFLCPKSISHEEAADAMLRKSLEMIIQMCQFDINTKTNCKLPFEKVFSIVLEVILEYFRAQGSMFCQKKDYLIKIKWKEIALSLHNLRTPDIYLLLQTGFCLQTSPATLGFNKDEGVIQVCHGSNLPNETVVFLHTPAQEEIHQRMEHLSDILQSVPAVPELVTVCRSVRDGYTPRKHSMMIEWGIVQQLLHTYNERGVKIEYDKNLLGGKKGWYGRYGAYPPPNPDGSV